MSDKDPVREQIESDAENAFNDEDIGSNGSFYAALELADRQDKIAWNRCLDEVIKLVNNNPGFFYQFKDEFISELEKKRR